MTWHEVYNLKLDASHMAAVQKATLTTKEFGIEPTNGLFGSSEWWSQIADGRLSLQTLKGKIGRVYMGSMGDWPEFEIQCDDGATHRFTRYQTPSDGSQDHLYAVGNGIEIDFVWQEFRRNAPKSGPEKRTEAVIAIRIEPLKGSSGHSVLPTRPSQS